MDFEEMNQRAYDRKPEPDNLTPAERMIWLALRLLYELHFHGGLTREEGVAYKQELKKDYERNLAQEAEWLRAGTAMKLLRHKDVNETDCPGVNFPWNEVQKYAEPDTAKEDPEMVEKKNVMLNGKTYTCECITKDEVNYIKMRSLEQAGFTVTYDAVRKLPSITAPQCRTFVPDGTAEVQAAIDTVQEAAGLEEQTIEYLLRYQYGEQLIRKLAEAMEK